MKRLVVVLLACLLVTSNAKKFSPVSPPPPEVTLKLFFDIEIDWKPAGRIALGLFGDDVPKTVENFRQLCLDQREGKGLRGTKFHKVFSNYILQGGDVTQSGGRGGMSIYGPTFPDENFKIKHTVGSMSMANNGPDTNNSQFFILMAPGPQFDGKNVVFGKVLAGSTDTLLKMERMAGDDKIGKPKKPIVIKDCGMLPM